MEGGPWGVPLCQLHATFESQPHNPAAQPTTPPSYLRVPHHRRKSIDVLKEMFRDELSKDDWRLVIKLKKVGGRLRGCLVDSRWFAQRGVALLP